MNLAPALPVSPLRDPASPFRQALGWRSVLITLGLGLFVALVLDPVFIVPFHVLLARTLVLAVLLLLVHAAARQWTPRWLPRWMPAWTWPVAAVNLAALPCTLLIYLLAVKGDVVALVHPSRIWGMLWIGGLGTTLGLLTAIGAGVRERLAQARARELQLELERSRLEQQAVAARLALLQARIEPHFLFNTLANVQALVEAGSPRAAPVLGSLIAYLRAALPRLHDGPATLAQELDLVRAYLDLMRMRMPDRLSFAIDVDDSLLAQPLPPMALLTLVENAVRHGIDPLEQGGHIRVFGQRTATGWRLGVEDDGAGIDPLRAPGLGLANLRERLAAGFGPGAELQIEERQPRGVRASIVVVAP
jgi:hypothetical protein